MKNLIGNALVGQSGGPTAAINATLAGVICGCLDAAKSGKSIQTLYGMRNGLEGLLREDLIDLSARFANGQDMDALIHTPSAALGSCRLKLPAQDTEPIYEELLRIFQAHNIRYFFYIGGNDSMDAVAKLSAYTQRVGYEMRVIGVPKTIDNDLQQTDHTPGFGSAAKYVATTLQEILCDCSVYRIPAVTVVEVMGRDAGWLTAASAMGGFAGGRPIDLVYLPERAFDTDAFLSDVEAALARHPNVVVAVSEGIRFADGAYVGEASQSGATDAFGHKYLAGTARVLVEIVRARFGCKVRSIELNLPQRCAAHLASQTDLDESVTIGKAAAYAAVQGESGCMMTFERTSDEPYSCSVGHKSVHEIANAVRTVPDAYINDAGNGVTDACARYLLPLMAGESYPAYEGGIPVQLIL